MADQNQSADPSKNICLLIKLDDLQIKVLEEGLLVIGHNELRLHHIMDCLILRF